MWADGCLAIRLNEDNEAVRTAVIGWVQKQLVKWLRWDGKIRVDEFTALLDALISQGAHKSAKNPLETLATAPPQEILKYVPVESLRASVEMYDRASAAAHGLTLPAGGQLAPGAGRRNKHN